VDVTVTVTPDISISAQPVGGSICSGGNFNLSVTASGSPDIHYQWEAFIAGTWTAVGLDQPTYNTGALTQTTVYRVWVNADESGCEDVYSVDVTVTVTEDISITAQPVGGAICTGGNFDLSVTASGAPSIQYQWEAFIAGAWTTVGTNQPTYNTGALTQTTMYRVSVSASESGCEDLYSVDVTVVVTPDISISAQPVGGAICTGGNFNLSVTASGSPDIHYQWEAFLAGTWTTVGADLPTYNTGALTQTTVYRVWVNADESGCEDVYSVDVTVTVTPDISISAQPVGGSICTGGNFDLSVTASGSPDIHYQWEAFIAGTWTAVGLDQPTYNTGALTQTTVYRVWVNADESGCEDVYSVDVTVTVTEDISITAQPVGGAICTGGNFDLSVTASGAPSIQYQWEAFIAGAWTTVGTNLPTYNTGVLTQTTPYRVSVSAGESGCEDLYSAEVTVTVTPDISISAQPVGGAICTGGNFNLSVTASGSPDIHYQWEALLAGTWTTVGTDLPTYNTGTLTQTTVYRVWVNADESGCEDVYSVDVTVTVTPDISISAQPVGGAICVGGNFDLSVTASGSPDIHYQWEALLAGTWTTVGADQPTYNTGALTQTTVYRVWINADESGCEDVYSVDVTVTVTPDISISAQPVGGAICSGGNFNLSVTASGSPDIHYQWEAFIAGTWTIVGSDLPTYNTGALTQTTVYRVWVNADESGCEDVYSVDVTVTVTEDISITAQPVGGAICTGGNFDLSVTASGAPGIQYQWEAFIAGAWTTLGTNLPTYNTGALTQTTMYRVSVSASESGCEDLYSVDVTVVVTPDISISAQPVGGAICTGGNFNLSVTASGSPDIHYQWEAFLAGTWTTVGADLPTYNTGALTQTTVYRVWVNADESGCEDVYSVDVTVTVTPDISISAQPVGGSICTGGNFDLSVTASGSPDIHYQWEAFLAGTWTAVGADLPTYNTGTLTQTTVYRVWVNADESDCEDVYSADVTVTVTADISISAQPVGGAICTGGNFDLSVTASGAPGIQYQWEVFDGSDWVVIGGANLSSYNTGVLTQTTAYRVSVSAGESGCEDLYSAEVTVTVTPDISISAQPAGGSICTGGNFDLSVTASGSPDIHFQWEAFLAGTWTTVGADLPTYNTGALTQTTVYRVWVNADESGCEDVYSVDVTVTVTPDITITAQPVGGAICTGGNFDLSITASGSPDIHYQWEAFLAGTWTTVGTDQPTYNTGVLTQTTVYRVWVNADESGCEDVYSTDVTVTVTPDISITAQPFGGAICTGGNFDLSVVATGSPALHYQWQANAIGNWANVGTDAPTYNTGALTATTAYRVFVFATESGCEDVYSQDVTVVVTPDISITDQPVGANICTGGTWNLAVGATGSPFIQYQWQDSTTAGTWQNVSEVGGNTPGFTTDPLTVTTWYRVFVSATESGCDDVYSNAVAVNVSPDISITAQPVGTDMCIGGTWTLTASASGSPNILYQWQDSTAAGTWQNVSETGGTTSSFVTDPLSVTTWYRLFIYATENGCDDIFTNTVAVNVVPDPVLTTSGDQSVCIGGLVTMDVTVSGGVGTNAYQWQVLNGSWSNIPSGNGPSYATVFTQLGAFEYRVIVTQGIGCQTVSAPLTVTVIDDPEATIAASATTICNGGTVTIVATVDGASGTSTFQWQQFISGAWNDVGPNNDTFITPVLTNGTYNYRLVFSQGSGCSDESNSVSIQVLSDPTATINGDNNICEGETVTLTSNVSGGAPPFNYHWQILVAGNWVDEGATTGTYITPALPAGTHSYRLFIENSVGCNVVSNTFTITSAAHPTVTIAAAANPICVGGVANFTSTVSGGAGTNSYSWQYNHPTNGWQQVSTSANYAVAPAVGTHEYRLIVTQQPSGCVTISTSIFMVVNPDPVITATVDNPNICIGGSATITSTVAGGIPTLSYQWYSGPTSTGSWTIIPGATSSTYAVPTGAASSLWYRVQTTSVSGCNAAASNSVQVIVVNDPVVTVAPLDDIYCLNEVITLTATVTGGTGTSQYQWQSFDGTSWTNVGTNSNTYLPNTSVLGSFQYRVIVTQNSGCQGISSTIAAAVVEYPTGTLVTTPASCSDNEGTLTVSFPNNPVATTIAISLDGGATYFPAVPDNSGSQIFTDLAPGTYVVWAKWNGDECAVLIGTVEVDELECGSICGNVSDDEGTPIPNVEIRLYADANNNDVYDTGETILGTAFTNVTTGDYCFNGIAAGEYVVVEIQPLNYNSVSDYDHTTTPPDSDGYAGALDPDNNIPVTLTPAEADLDNNFIEDPSLGIISGYVFDDAGTPLSGVTINLYADTDGDGNADGPSLATTGTNGSGFYSFNNVEPDQYVVIETNPIAYSDISDYDHTTTPPDSDGNDASQGADNNIPVTVAPGETDADNNFTDGRPGVICGNVSNDLGQPLSNVEMQLFVDVNNNDSLDVADIHVATTYTDGDSGDYCFEDVMPGEYVVFQIQPTNFTSISDYDHTTSVSDLDGAASLDDPDNEIPVTLVPNEQDLDNDYIEDPIPGLISGYVHDDINAPLVGVTLSLYFDTNADGAQDGAPLVTTTTNISGFYSFTGVEPGYYVVVETNPGTYGNVSDYDHTTTPPDTDGNDQAQGPDNNIPVFLVPNESDTDNNFVDSRPGTICGNVSDDTGAPISSVEIRLYIDVNNNDSLDVADQLVATTYTDGDTGNYCFEDVTPLEYVVSEIQPANYNSISDYDHSITAGDTDGAASANDPDNEIPVTLLPYEQDMDNDFIEDPIVGSITGHVYNEAAGPIAGVTIRLHVDINADGNADGAPIATTITNSSGAYSFTGVEPGNYVVIEITPLYHSNISDYDYSTASPDLDGNDSAQGPDDNIPVTLMPGEIDADNNFTDGRPGTICGNVSDDTGAPISSVEIRLYLDVNNNDSLDVADVQVAITYTDGDTGDYCFEDVMPAEYVVVEIQPANYSSVSDYDHTVNASDPDGAAQPNDPDDQIQVTLVPMELDGENDFIEDAFTGSITGSVHDDLGAPMANVTIRLFNDTNANGLPDGPFIATTTTNASGNYSFTGVEPGYYVVVEITPFYHSNISDYDYTTTPPDTDGDDSAQGPDDNIPVFMTPGEIDADNNFIDGRPSSICGNVSDDTGLYISSVEIRLYQDVNENGIYDAGDVLYATTYTDGDTGDYIFEDVAPGYYVIVEIQPANYDNVSDYDHTTTPPDTDGNDSAEGWDNQIPVITTPDELDCENNFIEDPIPGSITGFVRDELANPIVGVTITLFADTNADGNPDGAPIGTATSNASGAYTFSGVEPAFYVLVETTPANYSDISDYDHTTTPPDTDGNDSGQGADDNIPVRLMAGETDADNNFTDGAPGLICGSVITDTGTPIAGVELRLFLDVNNNDSLDVADIEVAMVLSASGSGNYCFENITPGEYVIVETQPANYNSVSDHDVTTPASDPDGVASADDPDDEIAVTLTPDELDNGNNFVEDPLQGVITGFVRNDLDGGMPSVTVRLFYDTNGDGNEDGTFIATTSTAANGSYTFSNLEPGNYVVVELSPLYHLDLSDFDESITASDPDGDDAAQSADNDIPVVLAPGETDADNIFRNARPGTICGNVGDSTGLPISSVELELYLDVNNNDMVDAGDVLVATVFSDGDTGNYCFEDITPGEYVVVEIQPVNYNSVSDYDHTTPASDPDGDDSGDGADDEIPVTVDFGETDSQNDFIDVPIVGSIAGYALNEIGGGVVNVQLHLYMDTNADGNEDGTPIDTVFTNAAGYYIFDGIVPGNYVVVEVQPQYMSTISDFDASTGAADPDGNDSGQGSDNDIPVTILPAEDDVDNNFVDGRKGRICGYIENDLNEPMADMVLELYIDINGNGQIEAGDTMVDTVWTNSLGSYCFENVVPGMYIVNEVQLPNYGDMSDIDDTPDPDGDDSGDGPDNNIPVGVEPNEEDMDNNFVDIVCPGLPEIVGFTIDTICSGESIVLEAENAGAGLVNYTWNFGSGSTPGTGTGIGPHTVTYISNGSNSTVGAFVQLTLSKEGCVPSTDSVANVVVNPIPVATINAPTTNLCYYAARTYQPTAPYIPGYTYTWNFGSGAENQFRTGYGPHVVEWHTTGTKTVSLVIHSNAAGSDCADSSTLVFNVIVCQGNITGRVRKVDGTGIQNVNVRLFPDVNLDGLSDGGSPIRSVFTSATGVYSMATLTPGQYVIVQTQPSGYLSVSDGDETMDSDTLVSFTDPNDNVIPVTVEPQEIDADNVFIESPAPGIINGFVFQDLDGDQIPEAGEGLQNAIVELWTDNNSDGVPDASGFVSDTFTGADGFYVFPNVTPANYVLVEQQPAGYESVIDIDPTADGDAVANSNTTNDIIPVTVANGETDANNYFIEALACSNIVTNTNDAGPGSLRYVIECADPGDTITFAASLWNQTIHLTSDRIVISKDIHIHSSLVVPRIMIFSDVQGAFAITAGHDVEMKNIEITSGLAGVQGVAIENYGNLTIWDVCVFKNPLLNLPPTEYLIYNAPNGLIEVKGMCHIEE
jgi:protocatechuate 3,4-dioxygenase beta subunit